MKALTQQELETFVDHFNAVLSGAQLQDIIANDRGLALGFRLQVHFWMVLDLIPNTPIALVFEEYCPFKKGPKTKPVGLFLNSHGKNLLFDKMVIKEPYGRVVDLHLKNSQKSCVVEIRLIPKQCNVIVHAEGKSIAWEKPLDMKAPPVVENPPVPRSIVEIHEEWLTEQKQGVKPSLDPVAQWEKQKQKDLEKKRRALEELQKQIHTDKELLWYEAGEWLKVNGDIEQIPAHLLPCVDTKQTLRWNMENCFTKAKQVVHKKDGASDRLQILMGEITKLEQTRYSPKQQQRAPDLMKAADAKGRKLHLPSGAVAYCGKSAADNLALLRQAKSWDFWLHLKDFPGAHAIIHRQRDQLIPDSELLEVSEWLAHESLSEKSLYPGQKLAIVVVETRFVRPIKGDKLGRVNYHSERTLFLTLRHS
jgi:Predicted RNA-binding protein homologous to eukaryotic snRNP